MNTADDERYIPLKQDGRDSVVTVASERTAGPEHVETAQRIRTRWLACRTRRWRRVGSASPLR
jgi:hypothetical protein